MRETGGMVAEHIRKNRILYLAALTVFCIGVSLGAGAVNTISEAVREELDGYFHNFLAGIQGQNVDFLGVLQVCVSNNFKYALFSLLISLTVYTLPLHAALLGVKGFSIGFTVGFLIRLYAWRGVVYGLLAALPSAVLSVPACAMTAVMCVTHCVESRRNRERYSIKEKRASFWALTATVGLMFALLCLASLFDAFLSPVVIRFLFPAV